MTTLEITLSITSTVLLLLLIGTVAAAGAEDDGESTKEIVIKELLKQRGELLHGLFSKAHTDGIQDQINIIDRRITKLTK